MKLEQGQDPRLALTQRIGEKAPIFKVDFGKVSETYNELEAHFSDFLFGTVEYNGVPIPAREAWGRYLYQDLHRFFFDTSKLKPQEIAERNLAWEEARRVNAFIASVAYAKDTGMQVDQKVQGAYDTAVKLREEAILEHHAISLSYQMDLLEQQVSRVHGPLRWVQRHRLSGQETIEAVGLSIESGIPGIGLPIVIATRQMAPLPPDRVAFFNGNWVMLKELGKTTQDWCERLKRFTMTYRFVDPRTRQIITQDLIPERPYPPLLAAAFAAQTTEESFVPLSILGGAAYVASQRFAIARDRSTGKR